MAVAFMSKITGDLELSFAIVQLAVLLLLIVGVYRFSKIWVHGQAAGNAALLLVASSAIAETIHVFGQLPTIWALAFLLNSLPYLHRWAFRGRFIDLITGIALLAACTAGHHVTTLFGSIFFLGPIVAYGLLKQTRVRLDGQDSEGSDPKISVRLMIPLIARRLRRALPAIIRVGILGFAVLGALVLVVLPYWWWSATDPITQISIPHGSRQNFLADLNIGLVFFAIPWGVMILVLPYALLRSTLDRKWPLAASILLLFVLGTGGTTPIPKMLLGPAFDVLTLDRFTFWATIQILPLAGVFFHSLENGSLKNWLTQTGGVKLASLTKYGFVLAIVFVSVFSANLGQFRKFQPDRIDTDPIVAFIEKDQHDRWRYLTLGFGDQIAWLSAQTTATQVDGNYHSVRRLPELTSTSVERLEGAKYRGISGLGSLQQFLEVPEKYNLKYVFSNDKFYDPVLHFSGWNNLGPLENGINVWERADINPLPAELPVKEVPKWQRIMWGVVPPFAVLAGLSLFVLSLFRRSILSQRPGHNLLIGPFKIIDNLLAKLSGKLPDNNSEDKKTRSAKNYLQIIRSRVSRKVSKPKRFLRLLVLAGFVAIPVVFVGISSTEEVTATQVVETYYEDLDFRRWQEAYDAIDNETKPDYELWRTQQSVDGGILASFSKLDSYNIEVIETINQNEKIVVAELRYLTSLNWYDVTKTHHLIKRNGAWQIKPEVSNLVIPPDQLINRADVEYLIQGRRRVTSGTTELTDVQDRPELFINSAKIVELDGQPVVVGEITNLDVDPAGLTITAVLKNESGEIIGRYNATEEVMHALVPRESTPFMIKFERVAAGTNLDFDPLDFEPLKFDDEIVAVEIYAKAVVESQGLYRGLAVNDLRTQSNKDNGFSLTGEIRNDGVLEAVIPRVLISYLDSNQNVLWVQNEYLEKSIRSQRTSEFSISLDGVLASAISDVDVIKYHNGIAPTEDELEKKPILIEAPAGEPYSFIRVDLSAFMGDQ